MPTASFVVVDFSPEPCNPQVIFSLTVASTALSSITGLTVIPGAAITGELDVTLGWFTLAAAGCVALADLLNGPDGAIVDVTYKVKGGKKVVTNVTSRPEDAGALVRIAGSINEIQRSMKEDLSKPMLTEMRKLNDTTMKILEYLVRNERSESDFGIKVG